MERRESEHAGSAPALPAGGVALAPQDFAEQFRSSFSLFWTIAAGVAGNPSLADDIVQEAALVAFGKLSEFAPGTNFNAWMAQTVRFVALNAGRREHKRRTAAGEGELQHAPAPPQADGDDVVDRCGRLDDRQRSFDDRVLAALQAVPDMARACLLLRTVRELDYQEISALLGIPEGTAMSHVHRSRQKLRELLEKEMAAEGWRSSTA